MNHVFFFQKSKLGIICSLSKECLLEKSPVECLPAGAHCVVWQLLPEGIVPGIGAAAAWHPDASGLRNASGASAKRLPPALPPVPRRLARHGCQVSGPGRGEVPAAAVFAKLGQHERVSLWEFALATEVSELDGVGGH